jgi:hypothetical protein
VETLIDPWRKSSKSGGSNGGCVEVARTDERVLIRDTTNRGAGHIDVAPGAWQAFIDTLKLRTQQEAALRR